MTDVAMHLSDDEFDEYAEVEFIEEMRLLFGEDRYQEVLEQRELDMQDATVAAPAGPHW